MAGEGLPRLCSLVEVRLSGFHLYPRTIIGLGRLLHLQLLEFDIRCTDLLWDAPHGYHKELFPNLAHFVVRANCFEWALIFLETVASPNLEELSIACTEQPAPAIVLHALCEVISEGPWKDTLHTLRLTSGLRNDIRWPVRLYDPVDVLSPLFKLPMLRRVTASGRCRMFMGDATIESLAKAWPGITYLDFGDPPES
ncbi:hypothetical protein C8Q79DRAFT_314346 [Trametes meyenii]|nr:hypothetical protein C8Q79DRAFT_314346 [Trametes meyenii]